VLGGQTWPPTLVLPWPALWPWESCPTSVPVSMQWTQDGSPQGLSQTQAAYIPQALYYRASPPNGLWPPLSSPGKLPHLTEKPRCPVRLPAAGCSQEAMGALKGWEEWAVAGCMSNEFTSAVASREAAWRACQPHLLSGSATAGAVMGSEPLSKPDLKVLCFLVCLRLPAFPGLTCAA
jgi:hypothetical protein